jgi:hypothetical protein
MAAHNPSMRVDWSDMGRLYPGLKWIWTALFTVAIFGPASTFLVSPEQRPVITKAYLHVLSTWGVPGSVLLVILVALTLWSRASVREHRLREQFVLAKEATRVSPEDFGFVRRQLADPVEPGDRPFYEQIYIPRKLARIAPDGLPPPGPPLEEDPIVNYLHSGQSVLLIGRPYDGKTRTMFEVLRRLGGFEVIRPRAEGVVYSHLRSVLRGKSVAVVLDDLAEFRNLAARELLDQLKRAVGQDGRVLIFASCRDG